MREPVSVLAESIGHWPSPRTRRAMIIGGGGSQGGISVDPGVTFAYYVRRQLRPIRVASAIIYDAKGQRVGEIQVDSVTGKRTRVMDASAPTTPTIRPPSV